MCVALSRAQWALFAVGNLSGLAAKSAAWARVREALVARGRCGARLPLNCPRHSEITGNAYEVA